MAHLDLVPTGGRWGSITRVKRGTMQLFSSTISLHEAGENYNRGGAFAIADKFIVFWDPKSPQQTNLFKSTVRLSETFYDEIINNKVPIDLRALYALKRSPMALDIYCWLTFRMSYLKRKRSSRGRDYKPSLALGTRLQRGANAISRATF